jgi:transposase
MESTGIYWKPVHAVLEDHFHVIVGNANHIRNVPGRKTDVKDAEWIADLVRHGLIRPSFIPPKDIRQLRDLVRYRTKLIQGRSAERNRVLKLLEGANIKLATVASDVFGKSGMDMLRALIAGRTTPEQMANLARRQLRKKIPALTRALQGYFGDQHRELLRLQLRRIEEFDRDIADIEAKIDSAVAPHSADRERLDTIPGVDTMVAAGIIAELGTEMSVFPDARRAAAWAGVAPGSFESAGKHLKHASRKGNIHLSSLLVTAANAAAKTKGTWMAEKFRRLKIRRGYKRAAMAIAHKILLAAYAILRDKTTYQAPVLDEAPARVRARLVERLVSRIHTLGYIAFIQPMTPQTPTDPLAAIDT